ncbi:Na-K-Cl cotransporter [Desulfocicer niacini]
MKPSMEVKATGGTLGTFAGVFTPSLLTILGIILFLRLGFVIGNAGLASALIILALANLISILTSFSLAAVATNLKVKGGGDYYLISRTLGLEFGGAIGIVLFLAQSVSIAFYCIGFGEAVAAIFAPGLSLSPQWIGGLAVLFLFLLAWMGADWATRFQYGVMAFLTLALMSFYIGGAMHWDAGLLAQNWGSQKSSFGFWMLFAIFFPAVTGFTQGVSMSGDLKDPLKSLPLGTFMAVGISICVYFTVAVLMAGALPGEILRNDYGSMKQASAWGFFIDAGVIAATLSSAMASFLGAPRILQSLSSDKIFPILNRFAKGFGPTNNPRRGVLFSLVIALGTIALGQLDLIARIVSMFFLISYGLLNYATYFEANSASPSFRPRFRYYHKWISLAGFLACLGVMLAIDFMTGLIAIAIITAIYQYLKQTSGPARWADGQRSYHLKKIRENLLAAQEDLEHPRDWRPCVLAMTRETQARKQLLTLGAWFEGGSGFTASLTVLEGRGVRMGREWLKEREALSLELQQLKRHSFPVVITAASLEEGLQAAVQSFGIGAVRTNTVLLNWQECTALESSGESGLIPLVRSASRHRCNTVILSIKPDGWTPIEAVKPEDKRIDVCWKGDNTSHLMLMFAHLMARDAAWEDCVIRVLAMNYDTDSPENMAALQTALDDIRITAQALIVPEISDDEIVEYTADATLVFMPFSLGNNQVSGPTGTPCEDLLGRLNTVAMVMTAEAINLDAEPEEGPVQELSALMDALEHAEKRALKANQEAEVTREKARKKMAAVELSGGVMDEAQLVGLKDALSAQRDAEVAMKKAARESKKSQDIAEEAEAKGIPVEGRGKE